MFKKTEKKVEAAKEVLVKMMLRLKQVCKRPYRGRVKIIFHWEDQTGILSA